MTSDDYYAIEIHCIYYQQYLYILFSKNYFADTSIISRQNVPNFMEDLAKNCCRNGLLPKHPVTVYTTVYTSPGKIKVKDKV